MLDDTSSAFPGCGMDDPVQLSKLILWIRLSRVTEDYWLPVCRPWIDDCRSMICLVRNIPGAGGTFPSLWRHLRLHPCYEYFSTHDSAIRVHAACVGLHSVGSDVSHTIPPRVSLSAIRACVDAGFRISAISRIHSGCHVVHCIARIQGWGSGWVRGQVQNVTNSWWVYLWIGFLEIEWNI